MTRLPILAAAATALALASFGAQAAGKVDVTAVAPEQFADVGISTMARERNLKTLTDIFEKLGQRLPDGQTLTVELLDVDLAGQVNPMNLHETRVLRGAADWPKIALRYRLQDGSTTLKSGEDRLVDMHYMMEGQTGRYAGRELGHEMRMVQRWFDEKIVPRKIAQKNTP